MSEKRTSDVHTSKRSVKSEFKAQRRGLRNAEIDTEPWRSPLDALAKGLISIGEKFRSRPPLRVL